MKLPPYMINKDCRRWLLWKSESQGNSKPKKVPYYANGQRRGGKLDSPEDIGRLVSFEEAHAIFLQGKYTGLGFALGSDNHGGYWQGIDFDDIHNKPELQSLITSLPGYIETSPSKNGIHAIGYGRRFNPLGSNKSGIEAYCSGRFFTVTGDNAFYPIIDNVQDLAGVIEQILNPLHKKAIGNKPDTLETNNTNINSKLIDELRAALHCISPDDYHTWISVGQGLKPLGIVGFKLWSEWSTTSPKFKGKEDLARWDTFSGERTSYKTIFATAQQNGWINPAKRIERATLESQPSLKNDIKTNCTEKFPIIPVSEYAGLNHSPWLIKNILPKAELVMVYGPSGSGKSFFVLDIAFAIAQGIEWQAFKASQGRVVYIAAEAGAGVRKRLLAYAVHHDIDLDEVPLGIIPAAPNFLNDDDVVQVSEAIGEASLIIVDTLACVAAGADENSSADMGKVIGNCKLLHQLTGAVVMIVHHMGKNESKGARGWSGIRAAVDAEMELKSADYGFKMSITKLKDGETNGSLDFNILQIELGEDDDGDPITSCVVIRYDPANQGRSEPQGRWRKMIADAIQKLSTVQSSIPKRELIELVIKYDVQSSDNEKRDQRKACISRALKGLIKSGYYKESDGYISWELQELPPAAP
ncbi:MULTISPECIES: AAA family ATPase [Legionella]|uniref:AAA+ ATPase domain-containing protein n=1 Tax=Legionella drozanskii LLAP-1 TaxID=1212489 RepID=A0A0W0SMK0_9GAMM|nr:MULTISPECIES: AAA family ATPase [Legionella]KTC84555.1 hypothetical protein Ldro_2719 [Legionella drozanskii LLAP-1]PJE09567.1 MAG: hypothetical protein CK430_10985 [Legionella sp.]